MDRTFKAIHKLYDTAGYLDKYGLDFYVAILVILCFMGIIFYLNVMNHAQSIRADWINQRCSPAVIPFAGFVNAPKGKSKFEYTAENFSACTNMILKTVADNAFKPIYAFFNIITQVWNILGNAINSIRSRLSEVQNNVGSIAEKIYSGALNFTIPAVQLMILAKDALAKIMGVITAGLYTFIGTYMSLKALMGSIYDMIVIFLLAMAAFVVILWAIPFTWGAALIATAAFGAIALPLGTIAEFMRKTLKLSGLAKLPKVKRCFDEDTEMVLQNGKKVKISELKLNDILHDGSIVTAIMKSTTEEHTFYKLRDIIVTGTHTMFHETKGWLLVENHPESVKIDDYRKSYMYCIGTDTKIIKIGDLMFADWDEINEIQISYLKKNASHILPKKSFKNKYIHKYIDGGFVEDTLIEMYDGLSVPIKDIEVNDILKFGERVLGIVKIDGKALSGIYKYTLGNKELKCGPNLQMFDCHLGMIDTTTIKGEKLEDINEVYHLITDKRIYHVNGIKVGDYNSCLDKFSDDESRKNIVLSLL